VRVSSNPRVLPYPISVISPIQALVQRRRVSAHRFLPDDVSAADPDFPQVTGYRQVTDTHLLTIARRHLIPLLTSDSAIARVARPGEVLVPGR